MSQVLHYDAESVVLLPSFARHAFSVTTVTNVFHVAEEWNVSYQEVDPTREMDLGSQFPISGDGPGFLY